MQVNFYSEGLDARMPETVETMLYRIVQECVNNVIKHSGANKLDLSVLRDDEGLQINVQDNGKGFNPQRADEGIGLKNIRSRVQFLKGEVEFDSAVGRGTSVSIFVDAIHLETPTAGTA